MIGKFESVRKDLFKSINSIEEEKRRYEEKICHAVWCKYGSNSGVVKNVYHGPNGVDREVYHHEGEQRNLCEIKHIRDCGQFWYEFTVCPSLREFIND
ncbi:hypothetical protein [Acinetobacter phage HFM1]|nr:hypothetical protein [Acinetobacter phage HFM1]